MEYTIREARHIAGMTQQEMSERLGIPKRSIESWEGGQRKPASWAKRLIIEKLLSIAKEEGKI